MKRAFSPLAKSLFAALLVISAGAHAAEPAKVAKPDLAKGEALYNSGDAARGILACVACHGEKGNSTIGANPKLSAQHDAYLIKQLKEFATPGRNQAIMSPIVKGMTDADMRNLSAFLSVQAPKQGTAKNKDTIDLGKAIYRGGIADKKIPACASCHGATGSGMPAQYPRLAGQHFDYTMAQLTTFAKGSRKNSAQMTTIAKRMSEDEMKAVADYMAGLK